MIRITVIVNLCISTACNTKMLSACCPPVIKGHDLHIDYLSVMGEWHVLKGCRMGRSDKVSLWDVALSINTRFCFFILE